MEELKRFAELLDGFQYGKFPKDIIKEAKENGIVIVSGVSDNLCELEGAICDVFDYHYGGTIYLDKEGRSYRQKRKEVPCKYITAKWGEDGEDGFPWTYDTDIPHETFEMFDDGEKYCRGLVFYKKSLRAKSDCNDKTAKLLKLISENPTLPVVPLVYSEVVADDGYVYWLGSWGDCDVDEYVCVDTYYGENHFYTRGDQDELEEYFAEKISDENEGLSDEDVERLAHEQAEALPWKKAIFVYVTTPEVE